MANKKAWGIAGMGVMGTALSRNFASCGIELALFNRYVEGSEEQVASKRTQQYSELQSAEGFESLPAFISALEFPRKILLMLPAGAALDQFLEDLIPLLSPGDLLIDGGNSHFLDTEKRAKMLKAKKILFLGMGVSGGEKGALEGPSLMLGGDAKAYKRVVEDLSAVAAKDSKGRACCGYLGEGGAGHFVKMVHNGIEYAEMQLLAEIVELFHSNPNTNWLEIQKELENWQKGENQSYLLGITSTIMTYKDAEGPFIDNIEDRVSSKGTGAWATAIGAELGASNSLMAAALHARFISLSQSERKKNASLFFQEKKESELSSESLKRTYAVCRWINHHQGFEMLLHAQKIYGWHFNLAAVAQLWSEGCIIKSQLMEILAEAFHTQNSIFEMALFKNGLESDLDAWGQTLKYAVDQGVPVHCIQTAWNYWLSITQPRGSGALLQAQRDYFGAHGFERIDDPTGVLHHGPWKKD